MTAAMMTAVVMSTSVMSTKSHKRFVMTTSMMLQIKSMPKFSQSAMMDHAAACTDHNDEEEKPDETRYNV